MIVIILAAMRCALSLAIGLAVGFVSAKAARAKPLLPLLVYGGRGWRGKAVSVDMGYVVGLPILVASVAYAFDVGSNAGYLGLAAAGFFLGTAVQGYAMRRRLCDIHVLRNAIQGQDMNDLLGLDDEDFSEEENDI